MYNFKTILKKKSSSFFLFFFKFTTQDTEKEYSNTTVTISLALNYGVVYFTLFAYCGEMRDQHFHIYVFLTVGRKCEQVSKFIWAPESGAHMNFGTCSQNKKRHINFSNEIIK